MHGMFSVTCTFESDPVTRIEDICTVDSRSRSYLLKATRAVLIVHGSHSLTCITYLPEKVDDLQLSLS